MMNIERGTSFARLIVQDMGSSSSFHSFCLPVVVLTVPNNEEFLMIDLSR